MPLVMPLVMSGNGDVARDAPIQLAPFKTINEIFTAIQHVLETTIHDTAKIHTALSEPLTFLYHPISPISTPTSLQTSAYFSNLQYNDLVTIRSPQSLSSPEIQQLLHAHLEFLLRHVVVNWLPAFTDSDIKSLFEPYFIPQRDAQLTSFGNSHVSLSVLISSLKSSQHTYLLQTILSLLEKLLKKCSVLEFAKAVASMGNECGQSNDTTAITKLEMKQKQNWSSYISLITSLPDRVANIMERNVTPFFWVENLFAKFSIEIESALYSISETNTNISSTNTTIILFIANLTTKLIRLGHSNTFIIAFLPPFAKHITNPSYQTTWKTFIETIELQQDLEKLFEAMLKNSSRILSDRPLTQFYTNLLRPLIDHSPTIYLFGNKLLLKQPWHDMTGLKCLVRAFTKLSELDPGCLLSVTMVVKTVAKTWSDITVVKYASVLFQKYLTTLFILLLAHTPQPELQRLHKTYLLQALSHYLDSSLPETRQLGMIVMEELTKRIRNPESEDGPQIAFGMDGGEELRKLWEDEEKVLLNDFVDDNAVVENEELPTVEDVDETEEESNDEFDPDEPMFVHGKPIATDLSSSSEEEEDDRTDTRKPDSDDEDDDEFKPYDLQESDDESQPIQDPDVPTYKKPIKPPTFIQDVIAFLKSEEEPDKIELGLKVCEKLVLSCGEKQLQEFGIQLCLTLLLLQNTFELDHFSTQRMSALVALVTRLPKSMATFLGEQFYERNYNLSQRFDILQVLSLAAQKISQTSFVAEKNTVSSKNIVSSRQKKTTASPLSDEQQTYLTEKLLSQTRRFSNKSAIQANAVKPVRNAFGDVVSDFFYPLLGRFGNAGFVDKVLLRLDHLGRQDLHTLSKQQMNMGSIMDVENEGSAVLLMERILMTAGIMIYCAPHSPKLPGILKDLHAFLTPLRYHTHFLKQPPFRHGMLFAYAIWTSSIPTSLYGEFVNDVVGVGEWVVELLDRVVPLVGNSGSSSLGNNDEGMKSMAKERELVGVIVKNVDGIREHVHQAFWGGV